MANDPRYDSRFLASGTSQAEVIYNELIGRQAAAHMSVMSRTTASPPGSPSDLDAYYIPSTPSGDWAPYPNMIAIYASGWKYMTARPGMRLYISDENKTMDFYGSGQGIRALTGHGNLAVVSGDVTVDGSVAVTFQVTLDANAILKAPTNLVPGRMYSLWITQDGVGGRTMTYEANGWMASSAMALTAAANAVDLYTFVGGNNTHKTSEVSRNLNVTVQ